MKRLAGLLVNLRAWRPALPSWRAVAIGGAVIAVLGVASAGAAWWIATEQRRGLESFADAMVKLKLSQAPGAAPEAREQASRDLEAALSQRPSGAVAAQVTYELGNLKYANQQFPGSRSAYEMTTVASSPTLRRLAHLGVGYTWEMQKDYPKAIAAVEAALAPLKAGDFLYDDLLMDLGRLQEVAGRRDDAIKTYQRLVAHPQSLRSDDARNRLAALGVQP
jgi:tetratricopeptide (TPR) repeat protein